MRVIKNMIDVVYCMSLKRMVVRRKRMIEQLSPIDFCPVYFFDAVNGLEYTKKDFSNEGINEYKNWVLTLDDSFTDTALSSKTSMVYWQRSFTMGEIASTVSHYMIWKEVYEKGYDNVLILEDDVTFDYGELLQGLIDYNNFVENNKCDLFYLSCIPYVDNKKIIENIVGCEFAYLLHAYILTRDAIKIILNSGLFDNLIVSDEFLPALYGTHPRKDIQNLYHPERKLLAYRLLKNVVWQDDLGGSQTAASKSEVEPNKYWDELLG